ncbi:MAG: hypothetical protein K6V36_10695 [Anaerolineae bacterium]|nr:hypothetical protein [Anaerolineae bacterium]
MPADRWPADGVDSPAPHCGLGGRNRSKTHFDICLRGVSVYLDGALVVDAGRFVPEELA